MLKVTLTLCVPLFFAACSGGPKGPIDAAPVKVLEVVKGDELVVDHGGERAGVRLLGVQAFSAAAPTPQTSDAARESAAYLGAEVLGREVELQLGETKKDSYGRYLAYVKAGGVDLNKKLVEQGHAVVYTEFGFDREAQYLTAEKPARTERRGLWKSDATLELVKGLRKQWAQLRSQAVDKKAPPDELLQ